MTADPPVPQREQVAGRGESAAPVRRADRRRVMQRLAGRVDDDEREPRAARRPHRSLRSARTAMTPVGPAGEDAFEPAAAGRSAALHLGETTARSCSRATASTPMMISSAQSLSSSWKISSQARGRATDFGSDVAVLPDGGLDADAGLRRHVRPAVDHLRDGRRRDAGLRGDVGDRRPAASGRRGLGCVDMVASVSNPDGSESFVACS